jgi:hypothetical protein
MQLGISRCTLQTEGRIYTGIDSVGSERDLLCMNLKWILTRFLNTTCSIKIWAQDIKYRFCIDVSYTQPYDICDASLHCLQVSYRFVFYHLFEIYDVAIVNEIQRGI